MQIRRPPLRGLLAGLLAFIVFASSPKAAIQAEGFE
jgi:hypothetical protein